MAAQAKANDNEEVGRRGRVAFAGMAVAMLLACNALTGVGDLEAVDCTEDCDASIPERTTSPEAEVPVDAQAAVDAVVVDAGPLVDAGADGDAATRPSFCQGITLYLPFEGSLSTKAGQAPDTPPAVAFVPGKFGQGADLTAAGGIAVYYAATSQGKSSYSLTAGTLAMWVKPTWQPPCVANPAVFWKPRSARVAALANAGPVLECATILGLTVDAPDGGQTAVGPSSLSVPKWNAGGWNHLVGTWSSSSPTLQFSLNGAPPLATANPWVPNDSPVNFLRIGSEVSAARSVFDEIVVWTRVLSAGEIAALAASSVSAAVACGL